MATKEIKGNKEYEIVMNAINVILEKATKVGGFHNLDKSDADMLADLSKIAEDYEDKNLRIMPISR